MSTQINSTQFVDTFGNARDFYQANANDRQVVTFIVDNVIEMISSPTNPLTTNLVTNEITSSNTVWLNLGFRVGQTVEIRRFDSTGAIVATFTQTIEYLDGFTIGLDSVDSSFGDGMMYTVGERLIVTSTSYHDGLDLQFNHSLNGASGNTPSLIDGENTTLRMNGLEALAVSSTINAVQVGNKSGQFACSASIKRLANPSTLTRRYRVILNIVQSGVYNQDWFIGAASLKFFAKLRFQAEIGEPYGTLDLVYDQSGDTGYYNEPYNMGVSNSSLITGINALDWYNFNTGSFTIESTSTEFEFGGNYIPIDENYYQNQPFDQSSLTMRFNTNGVITAGIYYSSINPLGAQATFLISTPIIVGDQYTFTWYMVGNTEWQDFFESRQDGDRRYVLYFRAGTKNITLFDGQMEKQPLPAGVIPDIDTAFHLNHSKNVTDENGIDLSGADFLYTEDDLATVLKFQVPRFSIYDSFVARIEAYNPTSGEKFTLQQTVFNMQSAPVTSDGRQLVNASVTQSNNLPSTSAKKVATFGLEPSLDTEDKYGLKCYYPYIILWQYWQEQLNANPDFYPNQNKDWKNYFTGDWIVVLYFGLVAENQVFEKRYVLAPIKDYNSGNTIGEITLYRENGDLAEATVQGEVMTIQAKHTTVNPMNILSVWSVITVEPFEGEPRSLDSNIVGNGNDSNNPLFGYELYRIGNDTFTRCKFDTNKMNTENGVSFGSRIFGNDIFDEFWITTEGDYFLQTGGADKWIIE